MSQSVQTFSTAGGSTSTAAPTGSKTVRRQAWGPGGNGANSGTLGRGGGGGGAYSEDTVSTSDGEQFAIAVGDHGNENQTIIQREIGVDPTVVADGGFNGSTTTGGSGGLTANCIGSITQAGGNGGPASATNGGGGGASAGPLAPGGNASGTTGGTAPTGGNNGGAGATLTTGFAGTGYGAGGGGGHGSSASGAGIAGKAILTFFVASLPPSGLTATAISKTEIDLAWTDNSSDETGFNVQRATDSGFTQNVTNTLVAANSTSYADTGLTPGTTYYYQVLARNADADSAYCTPANAKTNSAPSGSAAVLMLLGII